ncbi:hypothetical protein HanHA300_Chr01g0007231 [Helianthus annuus]|nr:hypothetical protein HanHA300_Chr01g0007231 [Helianthus annuus]KAJ0782342.1 hypothetical protein HanLR1_Chr01g0006981 [Helianthus annuus]
MILSQFDDVSTIYVSKKFKRIQFYNFHIFMILSLFDDAITNYVSKKSKFALYNR